MAWRAAAERPAPGPAGAARRAWPRSTAWLRAVACEASANFDRAGSLGASCGLQSCTGHQIQRLLGQYVDDGRVVVSFREQQSSLKICQQCARSVRDVHPTQGAARFGITQSLLEVDLEPSNTSLILARMTLSCVPNS